MIKEYYKCYRDKPRQLTQVTEFQKTHARHKAIYWYTKPCFVHRLINKALRTEDVMALWTFRYFISDLCMSLEQMRMKIDQPLSLYRGAQMTHSEIELLSVGNLVSTNGFFSTSRSRQVAELFVSQGLYTSNHRQYVLFQIDIQPDASDVVVLADVAAQSLVPDEDEVLFDLGTIFEIIHLEQNKDTYVWYIILRPSRETQNIKQDYERFVLSQMEYTSPYILFGMLFADMSEYTKSLTYFQSLLRTLPPADKDIGNIYYGLARTYRFIGRHSLALALMKRAERLQRQMLPAVSFDYARTLVSLATVYAVMGNFRRELLYYRKAFALYRSILPTHQHIEMARSLSRLSLAYIHHQLYARAASILKRSLEIYNQTTPENHAYKADAFELFGLACSGLGDADHSFNLIQKALTMRFACLPRNHSRIEHSYYVLMETYEKHGEYELALEHARKLLDFRERKFPTNHVSVQETRNLIEKLRVCATAASQ